MQWRDFNAIGGALRALKAVGPTLLLVVGLLVALGVLPEERVIKWCESYSSIPSLRWLPPDPARASSP